LIPPSIARSLLRRFVAEWDFAAGYGPAEFQREQRLIIAPSIADNAERIQCWLDESVAELRAGLDLVSEARVEGGDGLDALLILCDAVQKFVSENDGVGLSRAS
jgi:hypothetical protein